MISHAPRVLVLVACAVVVVMFWTNDDMAGQPDAPRGTGKYLPILDRGDGHMMYLMARSTAIDLDWRFDNDLARFGDPWGEPISVTGRKTIVQPIGPALVWTPLIWVAELGAIVVNVFGADIPLHGYTLWHQRFVFLSSALFACGAVLLGRRLARQCGFGPWSTSFAAIAILLGTSLTYYATYMPSYAHAMDAFWCAAFLSYWAGTLGRGDVKRWLVLGVLLGVATLVRTQELALGVVVLIEGAAATIGDLRARAVDWRIRAILFTAGGVLVLAVTLVVFVPQVLEWHLVFGKATALPQGPHYTRPGSPMVLELLFSSRNGWISTTPLVYAGLIGLGCVPRRARVVALGLIAATVLQIYLASTIADWWGSASFGQRRLCNVSMPLVVGLAALLWRLGRLAARARRVPWWVWRVLAAAGLAIPVAWNLWRVHDYRAGKGAPGELVATCCDRVPPWLHPPIQWVYDRIGNPFQFPANAWFAWRHDVSLQRWDRAVGNYPLIPPFGAFRDDQLAEQRGAWSIGGGGAEPYLVAGWSNTVHAPERLARWTISPTATILVPNLMPNEQRYVLWLAPGGAHEVVVRWDDDVVARSSLHAGWNAIEFTLSRVSVGEHELTVEAAPAAFAPGPGWPDPGVPVGVAASVLEMQITAPR
jgi:hypothetical protein